MSGQDLLCVRDHGAWATGALRAGVSRRPCGSAALRLDVRGCRQERAPSGRALGARRPRSPTALRLHARDGGNEGATPRDALGSPGSTERHQGVNGRQGDAPEATRTGISCVTALAPARENRRFFRRQGQGAARLATVQSEVAQQARETRHVLVIDLFRRPLFAAEARDVPLEHKDS